jgi:hypothetical protein
LSPERDFEVSDLKERTRAIEAGPKGRHRTVQVVVGNVKVGGGAPIVVQSMTNTDTADIEGTVVTRPLLPFRTFARSSTSSASTCR